MIAERLPELAAMSRDQKWLVFRELEEELAADDSTETLAGKAAVVEILEQRWQNYLADPGSATTWSKVQERMHAYRAQRRAGQA
ncbi:hypothetical protein [Prosthecobacter sp.]|uniref:hypothetical protein n=1 Tax=Prosthecobacter sp. TaxID=1965333 RepID=UPI003784D0A6